MRLPCKGTNILISIILRPGLLMLYYITASILLPLRHLNHSSFLHIPPLNRLCELIQHLQRRHRHTSLLPLPQRLTQQILKLDEIALITFVSIQCDTTSQMKNDRNIPCLNPAAYSASNNSPTDPPQSCALPPPPPTPRPPPPSRLSQSPA